MSGHNGCDDLAAPFSVAIASLGPSIAPPVRRRVTDDPNPRMPPSMVKSRPLIVLSLEGLSTSALGCYGSTWNRTPAIDAIASTGVVWDRWIAAADDPQALLRDAIAKSVDGWDCDWCEDGSVELLTDAQTDIAEGSCFDRTVVVPQTAPVATDVPAEDLVETQLGRLIAAAIQRDEQEDPWSVLWLHSDYLVRRWDAPRELFPIDDELDFSDEPSEEIELLNMEGDETGTDERIPPIFDDVIPPRITVDDRTDPDLVISWMRTYGCQIRLLDVMIEVLLNSLGADDPQVVLLGTSGFRLGQGGEIGHRVGPLRSPDIRLPMIVSDVGPLRVPQAVSSDRLRQLLGNLYRNRAPIITEESWSGSDAEEQIVTVSDRAQSVVTTRKWFFVRDVDSSEHLFLKPDDIEDFNDVGRLRPDVVSQLGQAKK